MKYKIILSPKAEKDLQEYAKSGNKGQLKKISLLIHELEKHPKTGTGKPKVLKHQQVELWSRRINKKHRLIYQIDEKVITVIVISAKEHYDDK